MPKIPILILHGWGGSKQSWQKCASNFDKEKYKLYIPDMPGFGSSKAPKEPWHVQDYADHIKNLIKEHKVKQPICVAHSFGCRVAIKLSAQNSEIFSKLVLIGAAGIKHEPSLKVKIFRFIAKLGKKILQLTGMKKVEKMARKVLYKIARAPDYYKTDGTMRETFKNVIGEDLRPLLKNIKTKTHIIWGDKDSYVPLSDAHIMNNEIANSTIKVIENGKHGLHIQMPAQLAKMIQEYFK